MAEFFDGENKLVEQHTKEGMKAVFTSVLRELETITAFLATAENSLKQQQMTADDVLVLRETGSRTFELNMQLEKLKDTMQDKEGQTAKVNSLTAPQQAKAPAIWKKFIRTDFGLRLLAVFLMILVALNWMYQGLRWVVALGRGVRS